MQRLVRWCLAAFFMATVPLMAIAAAPNCQGLRGSN
jgi:hypothetical protein